jgi:hypothetical protein
VLRHSAFIDFKVVVPTIAGVGMPQRAGDRSELFVQVCRRSTRPLCLDSWRWLWPRRPIHSPMKGQWAA